MAAGGGTTGHAWQCRQMISHKDMPRPTAKKPFAKHTADVAPICPHFFRATRERKLQGVRCMCLCFGHPPVQHIAPINRLPADEQVKAREELAAGPLKDKLGLLSKIVVSCSSLDSVPDAGIPSRWKHIGYVSSYSAAWTAGIVMRQAQIVVVLCAALVQDA